MDVSVPGTIDQNTYLKKFRGGFNPLIPPGSAYGLGLYQGFSFALVSSKRSIGGYIRENYFHTKKESNLRVRQ